MTAAPMSEAAVTACRVTRAELEQRLVDLERSIERHRTAIWLAERDREEARFELRRISQSEAKAGAA